MKKKVVKKAVKKTVVRKAVKKTVAVKKVAKKAPQKVPLPKSTATNSLELTDELIGVIEQEPDRLIMRSWVSRLDGKLTSDGSYTELSSFSPQRIPEPACGTVACEGGWLVILRRDVAKTERQSFEDVARQYFPPQLRWEVSKMFHHSGYSATEALLELKQFRKKHAIALSAHALTPPR